MITRIEIYEINCPNNIIASGEWNRKLTTSEKSKAITELMRNINSHLFTYRVNYE